MERSQTSSLDADLRIRLEGAAEALEQAVALLETATRQLARSPNELVRDDVTDLKAVLAGWAAVDEALERAQRHEEAAALVANVRQAREALGLEVARWQALLALRRRDVGPAEQLRQLVASLSYLGRPVSPSERALFEHRDSRPWGYLVIAQLVAALLVAFGAPGSGLGVALVAAIAFFLLTRPSGVTWRLLPDRLQVERPGVPLVDVQYEGITAVTEGSDHLTIATPDFTVQLPSRRPEGLARLVRSMVEHMGSAAAQPGPSAVVSIEWSGVGRGFALFTPQGAYVVREEDDARFLAAVLPGADRATVPQGLELLRHLPATVLAERIQSLAGTWWPADELRVVDSANWLMSRTFQRGEATLRVVPTGLGGVGGFSELDAVTAAWRR